MNETEERQRGYDLEMAVLSANVRRDNAEAQVKRLGDVVTDLESELADAYRKLEKAEAQVDQWERLWRSLPAAVGEWQKIDASLKLTPSEREAING